MTWEQIQINALQPTPHCFGDAVPKHFCVLPAGYTIFSVLVYTYTSLSTINLELLGLKLQWTFPPLFRKRPKTVTFLWQMSKTFPSFSIATAVSSKSFADCSFSYFLLKVVSTYTLCLLVPYNFLVICGHFSPFPSISRGLFMGDFSHKNSTPWKFYPRNISSKNFHVYSTSHPFLYKPNTVQP